MQPQEQEYGAELRQLDEAADRAIREPIAGGPADANAAKRLPEEKTCGPKPLAEPQRLMFDSGGGSAVAQGF